MVHPQPATGLIKQFKSFVFKDADFEKFKKYNIRSAAILLPKWEGFSEGRIQSVLTVEEVLSEITQVRITMRPLFVDKYKRYDEGTQFAQVFHLQQHVINSESKICQ